MLGKFKSAEDATGFLAELEKLKKLVQEESNEDGIFLHFPKRVLDELFSERIRFCMDFAPKDLDDFLQELNRKQCAEAPSVLEFRSDVRGWAGLIKMLINAGARVEVFDEGNAVE